MPLFSAKSEAQTRVDEKGNHLDFQYLANPGWIVPAFPQDPFTQRLVTDARQLTRVCKCCPLRRKWLTAAARKFTTQLPVCCYMLC